MLPLIPIEKKSKNATADIDPKFSITTPNDEEGDNSKDQINRLERWLKARYEFIFNEITKDILWRHLKPVDSKFKPFYDEDLATLYIEILKAGFNIGEGKIDRLICSKFVSTRVNPIREYFEGLPVIEGETEMRKLSDTLKIIGYDNNDTFYICFRRWLISCYACGLGYSPNQVCLVLIGAQGIYKSTWLDKLCPKQIIAYWTRTKLDLNPANKDTWNYLAEKFLINIDDQLATLFYKDAEVIKTYITAPEVTLRKAFSKRSMTRPRIANFVASVNQANFLTDTENRRYFVAEVGMCDIFTKIDMDRVWSEVKFLFQIKKEQSYFNSQESEHQRLINANYTETTQEEEWLKLTYRPAKKSEYDTQYCKYLNTSEIIKELNILANDKLNFNRLVRAIQRQGYEQRSKRINGKPLKCYALIQLSEVSHLDNSEETLF